MKNVYTVSQLALKLRVTERWVRVMLKEGEIPGRKIGRRWFVNQEDFHLYLKGNGLDLTRTEGNAAVFR